MLEGGDDEEMFEGGDDEEMQTKRKFEPSEDLSDHENNTGNQFIDN